MKTTERYFIGGFDPNHPTGNVRYRLEDNEDGTGTYYEYDTDGTILVEQELFDLEIPEPEPDPDPLQVQLNAQRAVIDELREALEILMGGG